ncbi:MAG: anthranilate phosphoribosyltransferase [uncultured bacterium]|nr:MAG: anthranilate phosphoribosyltransferase [uncultured bacterium]
MILKLNIEKLMRGENLESAMLEKALEELLNPEINPLQISAFLVLLHAKGETVDELSTMIKTLKKKMIPVPTKHKVLDIVGTGGDGLNTINISTGSAILAASCGVKIAKHGNRSVSSLTGSADVLEALGVNIQLTPEQISKSIDQIGIGFCYSPNFHPTTHALKKLRKKLNVPTSFNILGPLLNPANVAHNILGVSNETLMPTLADVLIQNGSKRSVVAHGIGLDEISCAGPVKIIEINNQIKTEYIINSEQFGLARCTVEALRGSHASINAEILLDAFKGKRGAVADTLIFNAAFALTIYGIESSLHEAVSHASDNLFSGSAYQLLKNWVEFSGEK